MGFITDQRRQQIDFRARSETFSTEGRKAGMVGRKAYDFVVLQERWIENLAPCIRVEAINYFDHQKIKWHRMKHHLLSSQICCVNFLMPFVSRPKALAELVRPIYGQVEMLPIEDANFVAFEWIGGDYLNESRNGVRTRGANCTSADAAIKFCQNGRTHIVLIEWKYTEFYRSSPSASAEAERVRRYRDRTFAPDGPLKNTDLFQLPDLFWEPSYQLLRQQILSFRTRWEGDADQCSVLHVAPKANEAIRKITSPRLPRHPEGIYKLWPGLLTEPSDFKSVTTEELFREFTQGAPPELGEWARYVGDRYGTILN